MTCPENVPFILENGLKRENGNGEINFRLGAESDKKKENICLIGSPDPFCLTKIIKLRLTRIDGGRELK